MLVIDKERIYISDGRANTVLDRLLSELRRRGSGERARVVPAFQEMRRRYKAIRPVLASYRMAYERPATTEALEARIAEVSQQDAKLAGSTVPYEDPS